MTLMIHCGGQSATLADVRAIPVPEATRSWQPINHAELVERVEAAYEEAGFTLRSRSLGLNRKGQQLFGVSTFAMESGLPVTMKHLANDLAVGYRSSLNKTLSVGLVSGARVFVCDNLALSGEIKRVRKHTTNMLTDLGGILEGLIEQSKAGYQQVNEDFVKMAEADLNDKWAFRLLGEAMGRGYMTPTQTQVALREWNKPSHEEWSERKNVWRLYSGMTEGLKKASAWDAMERYTSVHDFAVQHVHVAMRAAA